MDFFDAIEWRYATKRMDGSKVSPEKLEKIFEAIQMAPTSMGLQPFKVLVADDPELQKEIRSRAYDQPQTTECDTLLIFAAWDDISDERIENYINHTAEVRDLDKEEDLDSLRSMLENAAAKNPDETFAWSARQAYIALGFGLSAAAVQEVDSTPMEGLDNDAIDEFFELREQGMRSVCMMAIGHRDKENDWLEPMEKVRRPKERLFSKPKVAEIV